MPTALGLVVPLPSWELAPVGLAGSAGVWLVTGVFAVEGVCVEVLEVEVLDGELVVWLLLLCEPMSVEPGCCSIAIM